MFLSLVSLIALIVGAIGVGTSMHAHLQQKMDSIAIMKSIGGRSNQVIRIYMIQTLLLGLIGGLARCPGRLRRAAGLPSVSAALLPGAAGSRLYSRAELQGLVIGLLTTMLFTCRRCSAYDEFRPA